jgi:hypothetical protein
MLWTVAGLMLAFFVASSLLRSHLGGWGTLGQAPWWLIGPILAAIQRRPKVERAAIDASAEGLRIGDALVPRAKLKSAILRREHDKTYVLLRGASSLASLGSGVDVQVSTEEEADRLCRALALDAASTTAEFSLYRRTAAKRSLVAIAALVALSFVVFGAAVAHSAAAPFLTVAALGVLLLVTVPLAIFAQQAKLRVGADGIVLREGLKRREFVSHEEIEDVKAEGASVVIARKHGEPLRLAVAGSDPKKRRLAVELERTAESIVWRIDKAREAYRALAGAAPPAALALARNGKTAREWLEQLRRIGAGAGATFRSAGLTREQLLRLVESTTATAAERLAAVAALHDALTDDERPRVRVAAERCVEPALGERMVRVAFAPSDEELEAALDEAELSAGAGDRAAS